MNTTVPMPAWLRKIQQSWMYQVVILPTVIGFGGALLLQGCLADLANIQRACVMTALNGFIIAVLTSFLKGHAPGSTNFASDGSTIPAAEKLKELTDNVITIQAKAADLAIPTVTPAMGANAAAAAESATRAVAINNQIVKTALANEMK